MGLIQQTISSIDEYFRLWTIKVCVTFPNVYTFVIGPVLSKYVKRNNNHNISVPSVFYLYKSVDYGI